MNQPTSEPTAKVKAAAGGGVITTTAGLVALGIDPGPALAAAIIITIIGLIPAYLIAER